MIQMIGISLQNFALGRFHQNVALVPCVRRLRSFDSGVCRLFDNYNKILEQQIGYHGDREYILDPLIH